MSKNTIKIIATVAIAALAAVAYVVGKKKLAEFATSFSPELDSKSNPTAPQESSK